MNLSSIEFWMDLLVFVLAILGIVGVIYAGLKLYNETGVPIDIPEAPTNKNPQSAPSTSSKPLQKTVKAPIEEKSHQKSPQNFADKVLEKALTEELNKNKSPKSDLPKTTPLTPKKPEKPKKVVEEKKKEKSIFQFWKKEKSSNQAELLGNILPPKTSAPKKPLAGPAPELVPDKLNLRSPQVIDLKLSVKGNTLIYRRISQGSFNELSISYQAPTRKAQADQDEYKKGDHLVFSIKGESVTTKTYQFTVYFVDTYGNLYSQQIAGIGREYPIVDKAKVIS